MFGRRNPDQPPVAVPPASSSSESDIDLDLMPDLPATPPAPADPAPEPPPSDPAWHAGARPPAPSVPWATIPPVSAPSPVSSADATAVQAVVMQPALPPTPSAAATPTISPAAAGQLPPAMPAMPAMPELRPTPAPAVVPAVASERAPAQRPKPVSESVIGPDDFFDGRYRSERGVRIQGNARGSIESRQYIFVEGGAEVEADLSAEDITVSGSFNGKIECRRRLEVSSTGKVQGHVTTALLVVHEGGIIDGELHMRRDEIPVEQS